MKQPQGSLRNSLMKYLPVCIIVMLIGMKLISWATNLLLKLYEDSHPVLDAVIRNGSIEWQTGSSGAVKWLLANIDYLLIPLWVLFCVGAAGYLFYTRELREPIETLTRASRKIAENDLVFSIDYNKNDEMGRLCAAFEDMRVKLLASNMEIWQTIEERRRLSAAFSHDLRTPLTVMGGYVELMQNYGERISPEKREEILQKMQQQVERLKSYTEQMNAVQKLEDIRPELNGVGFSELCGRIGDAGKIICGEKGFDFTLDAPQEDVTLLADSGLILRVCENLLSNAVRFAKSEVRAEIRLDGSKLLLSVSDDGAGFSEEALKKAALPFYRGDKDSNSHFGLGLYICRLLCMKCGGELTLSNNENGGGRVTAAFEAG